MNEAEKFAAALNLKFAGTSDDHNTYSVSPGGKKYLRIVATNKSATTGHQRHVHAFVDASTGEVYKSAGWTAPQKGARYPNIWEALAKADPFGGYLYAGR
jgi:hypothetical protein